jgi:hypothetical protein
MGGRYSIGSIANMSVDPNESIEEDIISILERYSGRTITNVNSMIGSDIGIYGGDGVQVVDELEERFGISLEALLESATVYLPLTWWDRLRGRKMGAPNADLTVRQLAEYIRENTQLPR